MRTLLSKPIRLLLGCISTCLISLILHGAVANAPVVSSASPFPALPPVVAATEPYAAIDEYHNYRFNVNGDQVFTPRTLPTTPITFDATKLLTVLQNTEAYFQTYADENPDIQREGLLGTQGVTVANVLQTLEFMIATLQEDLANGQSIRLQDPAFINTHFNVMAWSSYNPSDPGQQLLRLTKYAVFTHPGSRTRTSVFDTPLYQLTADAESDRFYLNYTKQDVLAGLYETGGAEAGRAEPLAYLTRDGFEDALMQGTVLVNFTDGSSAFFNVDRNNGIAYVAGISPYQQGRYWYFREVDAIKGYGHKMEAKISIEPGVTFAGDVLNIGLGRIVVLEHSTGGQPQLQLGVIADTGGAFLPNLHQLDLLAGVFRDRDEFYAHVSQYPEYAKAYVLIKKEAVDAASNDAAR